MFSYRKQATEYRIEITGHLADEDILKAVKAFLNPASGTAPGFHTGTEPLTQSIPGRAMAGRSNFFIGNHSMGGEVAPWFDQPGGATQTSSINQLSQEGYLVRK